MYRSWTTLTAVLSYVYSRCAEWHLARAKRLHQKAARLHDRTLNTEKTNG